MCFISNCYKNPTDFCGHSNLVPLGYSQSEAGKSLGVNGKNISRWLKDSQLKKYRSGIQTKHEVNEELNRLRKENHRLKLEREILKKAAAFFANESR